VTIGFGTKLHKKKGLNPRDFPIRVTELTARQMLISEVARIETRLAMSRYGDVFNNLSDDRRAIVLSMTYQMGVTGILKFKDMWKQAKAGNWKAMAKEALDSKWAKQTPNRAKRHAKVLAGETIDKVYKEL